MDHMLIAPKPHYKYLQCAHRLSQLYSEPFQCTRYSVNHVKIHKFNFMLLLINIIYKQIYLPVEAVAINSGPWQQTTSHKKTPKMYI